MLATTFACGGGSDEPTEEEPLQIAETAPVDEPAGRCTGEMAWYCEDMNLELCEDAGCEIRIYEESDYAMCFSERPMACSDLETMDLCAQIRSCDWIEE